MNVITKLASALALALLALPALAEKADANKPVELEADRMTVDDANKVHILEGRVIMTKGTMQIRTEKLVVTQDANGFQKSVATGGDKGLARFRQKRDNSNEYIEGEAERIEHDDRNQLTDLHIRAWMQSGKDEVRGPFIRYDARTDNYTVSNKTGGTASSSTPGSNGGRVHAVIQPRSNTAAEALPPLQSTTKPPVPPAEPGKKP